MTPNEITARRYLAQRTRPLTRPQVTVIQVDLTLDIIHKFGLTPDQAIAAVRKAKARRPESRKRRKTPA